MFHIFPGSLDCYICPGLGVDPKPSDILANVNFVTSAELGGFLSVEVFLSFTHISHRARLWGYKRRGWVWPVPLQSHREETQQSYSKWIKASSIQVVRLWSGHKCTGRMKRKVWFTWAKDLIEGVNLELSFKEMSPWGFRDQCVLRVKISKLG